MSGPPFQSIFDFGFHPSMYDKYLRLSQVMGIAHTIQAHEKYAEAFQRMRYQQMRHLFVVSFIHPSLEITLSHHAYCYFNATGRCRERCGWNHNPEGPLSLHEPQGRRRWRAKKDDNPGDESSMLLPEVLGRRPPETDLAAAGSAQGPLSRDRGREFVRGRT